MTIETNIAGLFLGGFFGFILLPVVMLVMRVFGLYTIVGECESKVFILFGKVRGTIDEPGLHFPIFKFGPLSVLIPFFGQIRVVDRRLDQVYLRSRPVNSEEGTPMGIGVWYEMKVNDPVDYLFKNADPAGSLEANVTNATVRCLSNMPLSRLLEDRHGMSKMVRAEVSPKSDEWGYELGSVYIRKVHFRDENMIHQISEKVVNRLRQVTSAIRQAGTNQVNVIRSRADRTAASEFARAAAIRPQIVGAALKKITADPEVMTALFAVLEIRRIVDSKASLVLVPAATDGSLLAALDVSEKGGGARGK